MANLPAFSGAETFAADAQHVYAVLTTPELIRDCIPDLAAAEVVSAHELKGTVRPKFAFVRGSLSFVLTLERTVPGVEARNRNVATGIGAKVTIESAMKLEAGENGQGCKVAWESRVTELKGLLAMVPSGLIRGAAEKTIKDTWALIRRKVEGQAAPGAA